MLYAYICILHIDAHIHINADTHTPSPLVMENTPAVSLQGVRPPLPNEYPGYHTKLQSWNFGECGVPLHCHYSKVHSDPKR